MTIFNISGALRVTGDRQTTFEVRRNGTTISPAASYINFTGPAIQNVSLSDIGVMVTTTTGSNNNLPVYWYSNASALLRTSGSVQISGSFVSSGSIRALQGFSGSLTKLNNGSSYIIAGNNITVVSNSNGSLTISAITSSGGGGGGGPFNNTIVWNANGVSDYFPVASNSSGFDISASFDGLRTIRQNFTISALHGNITETGFNGTSIVELFRKRTTTISKIGEVSITSSVGNLYSQTGTITDNSLSSGDMLFVHFKSVMSGARDLSIELFTTSS